MVDHWWPCSIASILRFPSTYCNAHDFVAIPGNCSNADGGAVGPSATGRGRCLASAVCRVDRRHSSSLRLWFCWLWSLQGFLPDRVPQGVHVVVLKVPAGQGSTALGLIISVASQDRVQQGLVEHIRLISKVFSLPGHSSSALGGAAKPLVLGSHLFGASV